MVKDIAKDSVDGLVGRELDFYKSLIDIASLEANIGCVDGKIIGTGRPDYTQDSTEYKLVINDNEFLLIDIPGIEGDEGKYREIIQNSLVKAHVIFYVNGSGKKAEKDTLEKIKKYMHDGTSVYAIFNVHCKPKKQRIPGLDKTYQEELSVAFEKQRKEIVKQTEKELRSFLGNNFKGSICVNGLLSFCAMAMNCSGRSTIAHGEDKNLRSTQVKFLKEYSDDMQSMRRDSCIHEAQSIIEDKIEHFDEYILEENIKKLKTRLFDILSDITSLREKEKSKIKSFSREYDTFEQNCEIARDDFVQTIGRIGRTEVSTAFAPVMEALFSEVEQQKGKLDNEAIERIFSQYQDQIAQDIQTAVSNRISSAIREYQEAVEEAEKRLIKDLQRDQKKFEISMSSDRLHFSASFNNGMNLNFKGITGGALKLAGYTYSGFLIGSFFPGIGNIIGAVVGFLVGVGFAIWEFFASEAKRINKAKEKLKQAIDDQIDLVIDEVKAEIDALAIEAEITRNHNGIKKQIAHQKKGLLEVGRILDVVVMEIDNQYSKI